MGADQDVLKLKRLFVLGQVLVMTVAMLGLFTSMVLSQKQRLMDEMVATLSTSTQSMADQLKANQVPLGGGPGANGTFIVKQSDGSLVIDRRVNIEARMWQQNRPKLIYEMQKKKTGWLVYPKHSAFNFKQQQRLIQYRSLDELDWILAIEVPKPSEWQLLAESLETVSFGAVFFIFLFGCGGLWFLTTRYFEITGEFAAQLPVEIVEAPQEKSREVETPDAPAVEKVVVDIRSSPVEPVSKAPAMSSIQSVVLDALIKFKNPGTKKTQAAETPKEKTPVPDSIVDDVAIKAGHIKSPVLKNMIKQFRGK